MNITLDKKDATFASLSIQLEESDYADQFNARIKEYSKKAQLKGFRPGKVPPTLIKNMVGDSLKAEEVSRMVSEQVNKYIKDNDLTIIGDPLPSEGEEDVTRDWKNQSTFEFKFDLGIIPDYTYEVTDKLKFTKYVLEVDQKLIDETTENLLKSNGGHENPEEVAEGDFLAGKISSEAGDFENQSGIPLNKVAKKEQKAFIGVAKGASVTFDIQKAFDKDVAAISHVTGLTKEEAEKVTGKYTFEIENITRDVPAELNQEFFDKILGPGAVSSKEEYEEKVKESLSHQHDQESTMLLNTEIKDKLLDKTKMEVSPEFLKRWLTETNKETVDTEDLEKNLENYEREVKWQFLRNRMAEDLEVKVEDPEVQGAARAQIQSQFLGGAPVSPEMEETFGKIVENYLRENNGKNYLDIFENLLTRKLFDALREKVTVKEKAVKSDEFKKILEKAQK